MEGKHSIQHPLPAEFLRASQPWCSTRRGLSPCRPTPRWPGEEQQSAPPAALAHGGSSPGKKEATFTNVLLRVITLVEVTLRKSLLGRELRLAGKAILKVAHEEGGKARSCPGGAVLALGDRPVFTVLAP